MFDVNHIKYPGRKYHSLFVNGPKGFHIGINGLVYAFHIEFGRLSGFMFEREGI